MEQDLNTIKILLNSLLANTLRPEKDTAFTYFVKPIPACVSVCVLETKGKGKEICADKKSSSVWSRCSVPERYRGWG